MPRYRSPGIYIKEVFSSPKGINGVETSITAFVGQAPKGPTNVAARVGNLRDYQRQFGVIAGEDDAMGLAVQSYFLNGGKAAYVCSITGDQASKAPDAKDYDRFYRSVLRKIKDVSIIVAPGEGWSSDGSGNAILSTTLAHCQSMRDRLLIIDPPKNTHLRDAAAVHRLNLPASSYSVFYYPWVEVPNPFHKKDSSRPKVLKIGPSAAVAGIWARTDSFRGVWKAPAGTEASLAGVRSLQFSATSAEQSVLNSLGVNLLRSLPQFGPVVWGSRTLSSRSNQEWRYLPVRRMAIFLEKSIREGTQWAAFEANAPPLWSALRASIENFLNTFFRAGAFQGNTVGKAYFVRCGLGHTMTTTDIHAGKVVIEIGFAPLKPAEFVVIRVQQKALP